MRWNYIVVSVVVIVLVVAGYLLATGGIAQPTRGDELSVTTSFYPLYFFASEIGGDTADVRNMTPPGVEPHEYELTPQDLIAIEDSDLIILNGAGFAGWEEDIIRNYASKEIVVASEGLTTLMTEAHEHEHEEEEAHEEEGHEEEEVVDPHVWLSPQLAVRMVERIRDGFIAVDPANETSYRANAAALMSRLAELDEDFRTGLQSCARREIVTSHAAFGYIADAYGLEQEAIAGLSTEEEPSPQELAEVVEFAREHNITHIFFETLVSPELSRTIANEIGATTLVLNPLEGLSDAEIAAGETYFTVMEQNLANLQTALQCPSR